MKSLPLASARIARAFALSAGLLLPLSLTAKGGPNVNLDEPVLVEVQGPVDVIGAVEVVAEPVKEPFHQTIYGTVPVGQQNNFFTFNLPENKRVVVETVTVWATVPIGANAYGWLALDSLASQGMAALTFAYQGVYNNQSLYTASSPLTMRLDANKHVLKANVFRIGAPGAASVAVSIFGYLEDL